MSESRPQGVSDVSTEARARAQVYHLLAALPAASPGRSKLDAVAALAIDGGTDTPFVDAQREIRVETVVTACSNCRHMLEDGLEDNDMHMELNGITELVAENLDTTDSTRG